MSESTSETRDDWQRLLDRLGSLAKQDECFRSRYHQPNPPANTAAIEEFERTHRVSLGTSYKDFLYFANGWVVNEYLMVLSGLDDLARGSVVLDEVFDPPPISGTCREDYLEVGSAIDVVHTAALLVNPNRVPPHPVAVFDQYSSEPWVMYDSYFDYVTSLADYLATTNVNPTADH